MRSVKPAKHGRDHRPGGEDPIASGTALERAWPSIQAWHGQSLYGAMTSNDLVVHIDADAPYNMYAEFGQAATPDTPEDDGALMTFPVVLGRFDDVTGVPPYTGFGSGSHYWFHMLLRSGPDCPKFNLEMAQAEIGGVMVSPYDNGGTLTWIPILTAADQYAASSTWGDPYSGASANFRAFKVELTGSVGDVASTWDGSSDCDGGPGIYYFRFQRDGKNASSSGYDNLHIAHFSAGLHPASP